MNLSHLLHNAARAFGDRPALSVGDELRFTYREMQSRVARIAAGLRNLPDVKAGDRVALVMGNRPIYLEVLFAIWHAGLVAVPVNAKLHPREVAFILDDCEVAVCLVTEELATGIAGEIDVIDSVKHMICVDLPEYEALASEPMRGAAAARDDLAWIFYTSGTTGRPKGAMLSHGNLQLMAWSYLCDFDYLTERDCLVHLGPQSHAAGLLALTHVAKASHNILPASGGFDPGELAALVNHYENVSFFASPTMLRRLFDNPQIARCSVEHIRSILSGAAPIYAQDVRRALSLFGRRLSNGYGQGECPCTISAMPKHFYSPELDDERIVSVGIARTGVEIRVVDSHDVDCAADEVGEIIVRSDIVMSGYWKQPEASSRALMGGWLRTGDLGALSFDGMLSLKDRSKDLIISGGSNIYPREVEDVLLTSPGVAEAAVVGRSDAEWGESVVAFIVSRVGQAAPTPESLDRLCLENLARFKRPKEYIFLTELPRNNTGKVLKTELRAGLSTPRHES